MSVGILGETARNDEIRRQEPLRNQYHGTDRKPAFQIPMRLSNIVQRVLPDIFDADDALGQGVEQFRSSVFENCAVRYVMETHGSCHGR